MPLFEFDDGRLIPAQFGRSVHDGLTDDMLKSVREQVLEIVGRPLFPITWQDAAPVGSGMDGGAPRLTALDASGQVVSVEVIERLDSSTMIDSLSRLADTASLGWNDLAAAYPGGIQGFRIGWTEFRDAMPPSPAPGPRLVLVVGSIDDSVRPALDVLASSGVEVHEIAVRVMSNGRKFLDVQAVGPRLYGHNPNLLMGRSTQTMELTAFSSTDQLESGEVVSSSSDSEGAAGTPETAPTAEPAEVVDEDEPLAEDSLEQAYGDRSAESAEDFAEEAEAQEPLAPMASESVTPAPVAPQPTAPAAETPAPVAQAPEAPQTYGAPAPSVEETEVLQPIRPAEPEQWDGPEHAEEDEFDEEDEEIDDDVPQLAPSADAMHVIGQILGQDTPLVWQRTEGDRHEAVLTPEGEIRTQMWSTGDPTEAAAMIAGSSQFNGWDVWHMGDAKGPSLREALDEVNREIREEYENVGTPRKGRRSHHKKR